MAFNPTAEQQHAIDTKGNVLVSAAAGSGKTAVLVERVVKQLTDKENPVSADKLLIVTFTNAAAAEMRTRIERRLDSECRANPNDIGLLKQRQLLSSAKICTIDSFCIDLVRENFEKIGVSPDFKISEQNSLAPINEYVLGKILNKYYENKDERFFSLMDLIGAEFDDGNFSNYLLNMYNYSRQLAYPTVWFDSLAEMYVPENFNKDNVWYKYAVSKAKKTAEDMLRVEVSVLNALSTDEETYLKYGKPFESITESINLILKEANNQSFDGVLNSLESFYIPTLPRAVSPIAKLAKAAKDRLAQQVDELKKLFYNNEAGIKAELGKIYDSVRLLTEILKEFDQQLFNEYLERNTLTFHNTEHLALKLLSEEENKKEFEERYTEVCVDEYQDTNDLQDMLFYVLSSKGETLFAVGDVKQSIYGFRGAKPSNFLDKLNNAKLHNEADAGEAKKIILGNNFRSRPEICEYINFFFENMMTEKTGSIIYNQDEKLIPAAKYPNITQSPVSFDILETPYNSENKLLAEADRVSDYIKNVMSSGECIRETEEKLRKAEYSDFVILLRNTKNKAALIAKRLEENGIPVNYSIEDYAETTEVSVFLSLLKIIDNPDSDIELLSVLMSPIFGFTPDETAEIRIRKRKGSLYSALIFSAQNGDEHAKETLDVFEKYRILGVTLSLPRLILRLYKETGYLDTVSAMKDGGRRRGNLLMLLSYAEKYAAENNGDIGGFVRFILKQSENGIKSAASITGSNTVRIMSIHASKGLQFPVCIISGASSAFNDNDSKNTALYSADFGIGFKYFDEESHQKLTTIGREVILDSGRRITKEEELRLLYVAMTRAEDKLHFTANASNIEKNIQKNITELTLADYKPENLFEDTNSYYKWLLYTSLLHPNGSILRGNGTNIIPSDTKSNIAISISEPKEADNSKLNITIEEKELNMDLVDKIRKNTEFIYPFEELLEVEAKASVSSLANKAESEKYAFSARPSFMSEGGITATERGTAMHKIIEFIDFSKADQIESEIERLYEWQFITEREAKAVSRKALKAFFESDVFKRIKASQMVKREMRFLTEIPAKKINPSLENELSNEGVIVQGAIDLCFEEDGEIVVLDFKTDRTDNPESLAEAYGEQLSIYATACEKIFQKPIKEKIIYSFALSAEIKL